VLLNNGSVNYYILTSIPGLPNNVGFDYRIIGAMSSAFGNANVTVYSYSSAGSAPDFVGTENIRLTRTNFVNRTAGRGNNGFTVVVVNCSVGCMVGQNTGVCSNNDENSKSRHLTET